MTFKELVFILLAILIILLSVRLGGQAATLELAAYDNNSKVYFDTESRELIKFGDRYFYKQTLVLIASDNSFMAAKVTFDSATYNFFQGYTEIYSSDAVMIGKYNLSNKGFMYADDLLERSFQRIKEYTEQNMKNNPPKFLDLDRAKGGYKI